jgi:hypothetical protein
MNQLNIKVSKNALPNYQDLSFKMNLPAKKAGIFSIWAIGGLADDNEKYLPDSTSYENMEDGYRDFTNTGMYAAGISHTIFPDTKSYIRTIISSSLSYSSESFDKLDSDGSFYHNIYDRLLNTAIRVNTLYNRKISNRLTMRTGVTLNHLKYDLYSQLADTSRILKTFINSTGRTNLFQGYLQTKYKFSDKLIFTAGLHYAYFALSSNHSIEPRLGLVMKLSDKQQLSFGLGRHSKNENLPTYFVETENPDGSVNMPNLSLKMTRSTHYVAAYERMLGDKINIKIETYYQNIIDLPVPTNPDKIWSPIFGGIFPEDTLSNIGKGRNYGLELTFQRFFTNNYYFLITSSWFNSKYRPANGIWYNTKYNNNYINNFVGGKEFKWGKNRLIGINSKIIWSGGKRFIPLDLDASIKKGEAVYKTDELYSTKGKDYFRIDFGFNLHFFKEKSEHIISVDIQNLTNRINQWAEEYDPEKESVFYYPMAGIIPILNYRLEF